MIILGVHGVDTPKDYPLARQWSKRLQHRVDAVRWDASDSFARDVWRLVSDPYWRRLQVWEVRDQLVEGLRRSRIQVAPLIIVAHSAGALLVNAALRQMERDGYSLSSVYPLYLGTPATHPILGPIVDAIGLGGFAFSENPPTVFVNRDDPVASMPWFGFRRPWYFDVREVAINDYGAHLEHMPDPYLLQPMLHERIHGIANDSDLPPVDLLLDL